MSEPLPFDPIAEAARNWTAAGWGDVADSMAFATSVVRAHRILVTRVDACLEPFGLTFSRFEVLMLLSFAHSGQLPLGKISVRLQVHAASVTNAIDRLERDGLVQRVPHPTDGRTTLARLTSQGRDLATAAVEVLNRDVFARPGLPPEGVRATVEALAALRASAGDFTSKPTSDLTTPDPSPETP
jgi:DNA-binding MarR family transcriptional regulator